MILDAVRNQAEPVIRELHYALRRDELFSAIDALLLRPLPYAQPNQLMSVSLVAPAQNGQPARPDMVWSYPKYVIFRQAQHVFRDMALYTGGQSTLIDPPERVSVEEVGAAYLRTLGLTPVVGQDFARDVDAHAGAARAAILSYALWQARFNADPAAIGRVLEIDGQPFTIIGVAPRAFQGLTGRAQLFMPLMANSQYDLWQPFNHSYTMVARRAKGISAAQAEASTTAVGRTVNDVYARGRGRRLERLPAAQWRVQQDGAHAQRPAGAGGRVHQSGHGALGITEVVRDAGRSAPPGPCLRRFGSSGPAQGGRNQ